MARIRSVATALPPHRVTQAEALAGCRRLWGDDPMLRVFETSGVETRYCAFPNEYYLDGRTFEQRNADWIEQATILGERAARAALDAAGLRPRDVDHFYFATTTGLATPSVDARLAQRMGMRADVVRNPLFGIGCAAGAAMIGRAASVRGRSLALSVELCAQTFRNRDRSPENVVGAALFGDGAAAMVIDGGRRGPASPTCRSRGGRAGFAGQGPEILAAGSELLPGTEHVMGWDFRNDGLKLVLTKEVPRVIARKVLPAIDRFLAAQGVRRRDVRHFILHPGGTRVLRTYASAFGLSEEQLRPARESLRTTGNLSSAAVLFILAGIEAGRGDLGLVAAVGPGFAVEMALLRW